MNSNEHHGLMNDTKWKEVRVAMYNHPATIYWRTKNLENGYVSMWDVEWFYHFSNGEFNSIEWLEIRTDNEQIKNEVVQLLKKIHVPGEVLEKSVIVYGYKRDSAVVYI